VATDTAPRIGVVLVDPQAVVRAGIGLLLAADPDMAILAERGTAEEGLAFLKTLGRKSAVVVCIGLELAGEKDAFWLIRTIRELYPTLPLLVNGGQADGMAISRALFMGADSYVHKNSDPQRFVDAIRRTAQGEVVLEGLPRGAFGEMAESMDRHRAAEKILTDREKEVLTVAAEGLTARQIGRRLGVRERTVTTHLGRIYRKLGATSRVAAIAEATRSGVLDAGWYSDQRHVYLTETALVS
jgi:two-component system, NarL family, nitrate/nitrite response regulator NarL